MTKVLRSHPSYKELKIIWLLKILHSLKAIKFPSTLGPSCASSTTSATTTHAAYATIKLATFKPKFSGKPDENAKAHLLRTNNWMDTQRFQDNYEVQRFCFGIDRESQTVVKILRPINVDWLGL